MSRNKIAIITIIDNYNLGSFLQAYATFKIFKDRGFNAEIIDYERKHMSFSNYIWSRTSTNPLKKLASAAYLAYVYIRARKKLVKFLTHNAVVSSIKYQSLEDFHTNPPMADIYLTGSDQVWNFNYNRGLDKVFFLDFAPKDKPKYSYAASIGMDSLPNEYESVFKEMLSTYTLLSVREKSALDLLNHYGYNNTSHVLDPTLLVNKQDWEKIAARADFRKNEPYLLVYSVESSRKGIIQEYASTIAKKLGLKIYVVTTGGFRNNLSISDKFFPFSSVELFLSLFIHADFIVASSFHGTAFAINLNKEFLTVTPGKYNARVNSLLNIFKLNERLVDGSKPMAEYSLIDYDQVNNILEEERKRSNQYIDKIN